VENPTDADLDLRQQFMHLWLLRTCEARYTQTGSAMMINLLVGGVRPDLNPAQLSEIVGFLNVTDYVATNVMLFGFNFNGYSVVECFVDFQQMQVVIELGEPLHYAEVSKLEDALDDQPDTDFVYVIQVLSERS
jgi:hypothetical protein